MSDNIGKRIMVIGSPGSGKSTFCRQLAVITDYPLFHLDKYYWNNGWVETPLEEFDRIHERLIAGETWIIDGNYGRTMDIRLQVADTVIHLAYGRLTCLLSYLKRVITHRGRVREDMTDGCEEKLDLAFMKYIWQFPKENGSRSIQRLKAHPNKNVITFYRRQQAQKWLTMLKENKHVKEQR